MYKKFLKKIGIAKIIPIIGNDEQKIINQKVRKIESKKIKVIEITLRNDNALELAINIKKKYPKILVGVGTILNKEQFKEVAKYNFDFYVSPGTIIEMLDYAKTNRLIFIPGVITPSEVMIANSYKFEILKFFRAEKNGGISTLKIFQELFRTVLFIPSGGINKNNYKNYLNLKNVIAVGSTQL